MLKTMGAKMGKLAMLLHSGCLYPQFAKEMHIRGALILCPIPKLHYASKNNVLRNSPMCDAFKTSKKVRKGFGHAKLDFLYYGLLFILVYSKG